MAAVDRGGKSDRSRTPGRAKRMSSREPRMASERPRTKDSAASRNAPGNAGSGEAKGNSLSGGRAAEEVITSRLCVKNVPKYATESRIREFFGKVEGVEVTDVRILRRPDGVSRQVAFIGFRSEDKAEKAKKYYDKAFFDTCRLTITFALPYGDARLNRPWAKNGKANPAAKRGRDESAGAESADSAVKKKKKDGAGSGSANPKLAEFLALMQPRSQSQFWADDGQVASKGAEAAATSAKGDFDDSDSDSDCGDDRPSTDAANGAPSASAEKDSGKGGVHKREKQEPGVELAADTGRLFVRNLSFATTEKELEDLFSTFGPVTEAHIPLDEAKRSRGFGYVLFMFPEHAVKALASVDGTIFQGRLLHVMPALLKPGSGEDGATDVAGTSKTSSFKQKKEAERREKAGDSTSWNALFIRSDAALTAVADQLGVNKSELLLGDDGAGSDDEGAKRGSTSAAVRAALSETRVIAETKQFLADEGVNVDQLEQGVRDPASVPRSKTCILIKNLPAQADGVQLRQMFATYGELGSFVMPPSKTMALVAFFSAKEAKKAFRGLAYKRYKQVPLYLEWAPEDVVSVRDDSKHATEQTKPKPAGDTAGEAEANSVKPEVKIGAEGKVVQDFHTLFVKNLHFDTREEQLRSFFEKLVGVGSVTHASVPKKKSSGGTDLSLGYGFVEFADAQSCRKGLRLARGQMLDGHELEIQISERKVEIAAVSKKTTERRKAIKAELAKSGSKAAEKLTKIVIRNLAFEANKKEIKQLVSAYGQVNSIRLPKKFDGTHRGFAFIDFVTHQEAKAAFAALTNTHLYGRHLVIEWAEDSNNLETIRERASHELARSDAAEF